MRCYGCGVDFWSAELCFNYSAYLSLSLSDSMTLEESTEQLNRFALRLLPALLTGNSAEGKKPENVIDEIYITVDAVSHFA